MEDPYRELLLEYVQDGKEPILHCHVLLQPRVLAQVQAMTLYKPCLDRSQTLKLRLLDKRTKRNLDNDNTHWYQLLDPMRSALPLTIVDWMVRWSKGLPQRTSLLWEMWLAHQGRKHIQQIYTRRAYQINVIKEKIIKGATEEKIVPHLQRAIHLTNRLQEESRDHIEWIPKQKKKKRTSAL